MRCRFKGRFVTKIACMALMVFAIATLFLHMYTSLRPDGQGDGLSNIVSTPLRPDGLKNGLSNIVYTPLRPDGQKNGLPNIVYTPLRLDRQEDRLPNIVMENSKKNRLLGEQPSICLDKKIIKNSTITRLGSYPEGKGFVTIGISSIARPHGDNYLIKTIQGLIDHTSDEDRHEIFVVIFLADFEEAAKSATLMELSNRFKEYIYQGFIRVILAPNEFYPALSDMKKKFGDNPQRIFWRSKQNVDFAFLMCYCHGLSQYYLHLEDDVLPAPSFYPKLRDFISSVKTPWPILDACFMGHLAKVYHANELENLAAFFYLMYDEMPVDWLIAFWRRIKYDRPYHQEFIFPPASLFQHIGSHSSFAENKGRDTEISREKYFDQYDLKYKGLNPPATVGSQMSSSYGHPQDAYNRGYGYFRTKNVKKDDFIIVQFTPAVSIRKVFVDTGSYIAPDDELKSAVLQASFNNKNEQHANGNEMKTCTVFETIGNFLHGKVEVTLNENKTTSCLRVLVTQDQTHWVFFREIDVWQV